MAPSASGSRPYFSPLMPDGYLEDITIPLVLIEGPVKVDSCYEHIPTGYCFVGLTGTWNTKDRRDENGNWDQGQRHPSAARAEGNPDAWPQGHHPVRLRHRRQHQRRRCRHGHRQLDAQAWSTASSLHPSKRARRQKNGADDFLVRHGAQALEDLLEAAEVEGWPLPSSLLQHNGELKRSYTPAEETHLVKALADINDIQIIDDTCRVLATKFRIHSVSFWLTSTTAGPGTTENGFLVRRRSSKATTTSTRSWIVPYLLPRVKPSFICAIPAAVNRCSVIPWPMPLPPVGSSLASRSPKAFPSSCSWRRAAPLSVG